MSKIGKKPVEILKGAKASVKEDVLLVEGPKGKLEFPLPSGIICEEKDGKLYFTCQDNSKQTRALQGTSHALAVNMFKGVVEGYTKTLLIEGVGYKAAVQGKNLKLNVGFSHPVEYLIPEGIKIDAAKQVEKGNSRSQYFKVNPIFPPILAQMVKVGEETGKLDESLIKLSTYFESQSDQTVKGLTTAIEPLIMIILGVGVGFIVFSIITPIYKLTTSIQ